MLTRDVWHWTHHRRDGVAVRCAGYEQDAREAIEKHGCPVVSKFERNGKPVKTLVAYSYLFPNDA